MPRKRLSIDALKASGSYRPSRHGSREREERALNAPIPAPAESLPAEVQTERDALAALLGTRLTALDGRLLDELAERVVEVRRLRVSLRSAVPGSPEHTRATRALTAATACLDRLAREFGLTPGSRTSLPEQPATRPGVLTWK